MTQQEKDEMNRRRTERMAKDNKGRIIAAAVVPVIGIAISLAVGFAGKSKQDDISSATVLSGQSVGQFIEENDNGSAIYTGTVTAVDPAGIRGESGDYIYIHRKIENEQKIYNDETGKYDTEKYTISDDSDSCDEITIDDVSASYNCFHSLPTYSEEHKDGADSNLMKTSYSYTPASVPGTFFIKVKNGEISSVDYYKSADVAGESRKGFGLAKVLIWLIIIVIEILLIVKIIKTGKIVKRNRQEQKDHE